MADRSEKLTVGAFLRPRGLLLVLGGGLATLTLLFLTPYWMTLAGLAATVAAYGWSVADSLNDPAFAEEMARQSLDAAPSPAVRLQLAVLRGSPLLQGELQQRHQALAKKAQGLIDCRDGAPPELKPHLDDVPRLAAALVDDFERVAAEAQRLAALRDPAAAEVQARARAQLDRIAQAMDAAEGTVRSLAGGDAAALAVDERMGELLADVRAVSDTARDLKLLGS